MKYGYSVLLSELLPANECFYQDCKQLQITCPQCKEPLFKVHRDKQDIDYFSHYKDDHIYPEECELRVSSFTPDYVEQHNNQSRTQSLKLFIAQFRGQFRATEHFQRFGKTQVKTTIRKNHLFQGIADQIFTLIANKEGVDGFLNNCKQYIYDENNEFSGKYLKVVNVQERITEDVLEMLVVRKERENFTELLSVSFLMIVQQIHNDYSQEELSYHLRTYQGKESIDALIYYYFYNSHSKKDNLDFMNRLHNVQTDSGSGLTYYYEMMINQVCYVLFNVPFQKMLNHKDGDEWESKIFLREMHDLMEDEN